MPIPPPPVPQRLREMLKDYPDLIERLQADLTYVANAKRRGTPLFERAIWMLEDALGGFISEAREELEAAVASGDPDQIARARRKEFAVGSARVDMGGLPDLYEYCKRLES